MRLHRFFLTVALITVLVAGPAAHADLNYRAKIVEWSSVARLTMETSQR